MKNIVIVLNWCLLTLPLSVQSQDIRVGGKRLKNIENRWIYDKKTESRLQKLNLEEEGLKKIALCIVSDSVYNFYKTSINPLNNIYKEVSTENSIDTLVKKILKEKNLQTITYFPKNRDKQIFQKGDILGYSSKFTDEAMLWMDTLSKHNFDALLILSDFKMPDYFTRTNLRTYKSKGFFNTKNLTLVYHSFLCSLIILNPGIKPEEGHGFQQLSAKIINSHSKMDYDKFVDLYSGKASELLSKQIEHNLEQIFFVYFKR